MTLSILAFPSGPVATNAYLVIDNESKTALIIDAPIDVADAIVAAASESGATIEKIVITHTHWDHVGDAAELKERTGAPLLAHPLAIERLANPGSSTIELPFDITPVVPDQLLNEGDVVGLGEHRFVVMHLPGHEVAHIVLYSEDDLVFLGGDVIFPNGHGRTDIPGSDQIVMNESLCRLVDLPGDVVIYPGHGATTTIGQESWLQGRAITKRRKGRALTPFAFAVERYLTQLSSELLDQLRGVPEDDLNHWRPVQGLEDINTFFALATHTVGAGEFWILHAAAGRPTERNRPAEFRAEGSLPELILRFDRWLEATRVFLETLTDDDLSNRFDREGDEPVHWTVAECIVHAVEHTAVHLGHLQIQRQLWNAEHRD